jgi:hypothetical protein
MLCMSFTASIFTVLVYTQCHYMRVFLIQLRARVSYSVTCAFHIQLRARVSYSVTCACFLFGYVRVFLIQLRASPSTNVQVQVEGIDTIQRRMRVTTPIFARPTHALKIFMRNPDTVFHKNPTQLEVIDCQNNESCVHTKFSYWWKKKKKTPKTQP